jgi:hypothetical protein
MPKKVHKLKDQQEEAFQLIAIASHQSDYRLSWALNRKLNWNLQKAEDLTVQNPKSPDEQRFTTYSFTDTHRQTMYLIGNKSSDGFLFPSMTNIDFLLKADGLPDEDIHLLITRIRQIDFVITAFKLENLSAKDRKKIIF